MNQVQFSTLNFDQKPVEKLISLLKFDQFNFRWEMTPGQYLTLKIDPCVYLTPKVR